MNIKLRVIQAALKVATKLADKAEYIREELYWAEVRNTPVGPNPHKEGSLEWHLHEEGNKLAASFRWKVVNGPSPWLGAFSGNLENGAESPEFGYCATINFDREETNNEENKP